MTKDHSRLMAYIDKTSVGKARAADLDHGDNKLRGTHDRPAVFIEPSNKQNHQTKVIKTRL